MQKLLADEQKKDADAYARAWQDCERGAEPQAVADLRVNCGELQEHFTPDGVVRQPVAVASANALVAMAGAASGAFHAALRPVIEDAGGEYRQGPRKLPDRIDDKARDDYDNDHGRVIDVERATGVFQDLASFGRAIAQLLALGGSGELLIRRAKDRINTPMKGSGYRDVLVNVEVAGFVGELQLSLARLLEVKSSAHRIYNLTRALGGEGGLLDALGEGPAPTVTLHAACEGGGISIVRRWLRRGADVDLAENGRFPLWIACEQGHAEVVRMLLEKGAEVDATDEDGRTALYIACWKGKVEAARLVLERGAEVNKTNKYGETSLLIACSSGHVDAARLVLERDTSAVNMANVNGKTHVWCACEKGHVDVVRLLLEKGADATQAMNGGSLPLSIATSNGHSAVVALLEDHVYPLHGAARTGDVAALTRLLGGESDTPDLWEVARDLTVKTEPEMVALSAASIAPSATGRAVGSSGAVRISTVTASLAAASSPRRRSASSDEEEVPAKGGNDSSDGEESYLTTERAAQKRGKRPLAEESLKARKVVEIDALKEGVTPLMVACAHGQVDAARFLLERGARLDLKPGYGQQLMYDSCKSGHAGIAQLLTERGTKADPVDENGRTPLFTACLNGDLKAARVFLDLGAQINRRSKKGNTPLWKACHGGHVDVMRLLLDKGAEVNAANRWGGTPLYAACFGGHVHAARMLLDRGAELERARKDGATPLYATCTEGHVEVAKLLLERGAKAVLTMKRKGSGDFPPAIDALLGEWQSRG